MTETKCKNCFHCVVQINLPAGDKFFTHKWRYGQVTCAKGLWETYKAGKNFEYKDLKAFNKAAGNHRETNGVQRINPVACPEYEG